MRKRNAKRKCIFKRIKIMFATLIVFCAVALMTFILYDDGILLPNIYIMFFRGDFENITCHYVTSGDALTSVDDKNYTASSNSIFFLETSCTGTLNSRQACAIESAAKTHPEWTVNVFFVSPVSGSDLNKTPLAQIKQLKNIVIARIHVLEYAKNTPLHKMVANGALNRTKWRISHASDVLRYLTLYKRGGVYLDLDVVVARSFASLARNFAARESDAAVAAGVLSFGNDALGREMAEDAVGDIRRNYRGDRWGHNGPGVITRLLQRRCGVRNTSRMSASVCSGFEVYDSKNFYPIHWKLARKYFEAGDVSKPDVYVYHVWNRLTKSYKVTNETAYARLAKRYCPTIYENYGNDFGV